MSISIDEEEDNLFVRIVESNPIPKEWAEADLRTSVETMRQLRDMKRDQGRRQYAQP